MVRGAVIVPVEAGGPAGAAVYSLGGLPEGESYARLFDALLGTIGFGARRRPRVGGRDGRVAPGRDCAL